MKIFHWAGRIAYKLWTEALLLSFHMKRKSQNSWLPHRELAPTGSDVSRHSCISVCKCRVSRKISMQHIEFYNP